MADLHDVAERVWYGGGAAAAVGRAALTIPAAAYGAVVAARGRLYDGGVLAADSLALPALSVGNLTVGGTGKTPVAAWVAGRFAAVGERPAVVLRGYRGDDEARVHELLTPGAVVVTAPDRRAGVARARVLGATVAVLDDAFQHRRARRDVDLVLVSADRWPARPALLPAGPFREPLAALRRATAIVVTRKAASDAQVARVTEAVATAAPAVPLAVVRLAPGDLGSWDGGRALALASLAGRTVLAVSAIGDPASFERQLAAAGARVVARRFRDHHPFTAAEAAALAREAAAIAAGDAAGGALAVCTLKDAVKLGPFWPAAVHPLLYLSQRLAVERGADALEAAVGRTLASRPG